MLSRNLLRTVRQPNMARIIVGFARCKSGVAAPIDVNAKMAEIKTILSKEFPKGKASDPEAYDAKLRYLAAHNNMTVFNTDIESGNQFLESLIHTEEHGEKTAQLWKRIAIFVFVPAIIVTAIHTYFIEMEHAEHRKHMLETPDDQLPKEMEFQNIRSKDFFWGEGDKTLFWNEGINRHRRD